VVTVTSQALIPIRKDNLLVHYHAARIEAFSTTTIQSAFRKTGIWPLNRDAIPLSAFEPSKSTSTQAAQPLPAYLPSILVPTPPQTPNPTPNPSVAMTTALQQDADTPAELTDEEEEPMEQYHIEVPPPIPGTSSRQALRAENKMLRDIITQAGVALEEDYAQMKLMDLENERLRKRAFQKERRKNLKLTSGRARHMTAAENLDSLAQQDWESMMKDVFKEAGPRFKILKKNIVDYHKEIEKAKKVAEREVKKAATAAAQARGRGRGTRAGRRGGGRGTRGRGRGAAVARDASDGADDSDSEPSGISGPSESSSESDSESEAEIPIPRSRRQRPVRVIQGRREELAVREMDEEGVAEDETDQPAEQPPPRRRPRQRPIQTRDDGDVEASSGANAINRDNEPAMQDGGEREHGIGARFGVALASGVRAGGSEVQDRGIGVLSTMQSSEMESQGGPPRRQNPRRGKQSDNTNT
jgi:hypothetical protein